MDIKQELRRVLEQNSLLTMPRLDIEELCRAALAEIERLENVTRTWPAPAITQDEVRLIVREELVRLVVELTKQLNERTKHL